MPCTARSRSLLESGSATVRFSLGLLALAGVTLLWVRISPDLTLAEISLADLRLPIAIGFTLIPLAWVAASFVSQRLRIDRLRLTAPPATIVLRQILIGARISKSGNALPQSGDLQVLSAATNVHRTETIELTIADVVP
ncbi:MAG: hypothetical protein ABI451_05200 [Dokdonella sp.]